MKISSLVALAILLCIGTAEAQNPNLDFKYSVKVSNLSTLQKHSEVNRVGNNDTAIIDEHNNLRLFHPTIAFQIKNKRNNIHEIELTDLSVARNTFKNSLSYNLTQPLALLNGSKVTATHISLRYEYISTFSKKINTRFMPSLGLAILPCYQRNSYRPMTSSDFPSISTTIGAKGFITPRVCYNVSRKLFIDLNIPICVLDTYTQMYKYKNPNVPANEQSEIITNFDLFPDFFSLRLGLGLRI